MPQLILGGAASGGGRMHEQTFNVLLARALRARRKAWQAKNAVRAERLDQVIGSSSRPDIVVDLPNAYPLIIEVGFKKRAAKKKIPAKEDAIGRIGLKLKNGKGPIRSAIAVGAPESLRYLTEDELERRLLAKNGGGASPTRLRLVRGEHHR